MSQCTCADTHAEKAIDLALLEPAFTQYASEPGAMIPLLQATQDIYGYLPEVALQEIARVLDVPLSSVYGVATFYTQFHLTPRGDTIIRICHGTACHVRGATEVTNAISGELGVNVGETSEDLSFTVESVACVGCCGLAPVVVVDDQMHGGLDAKSARKIAKSLRRKQSK